jgi:TonB family protein
MMHTEAATCSTLSRFALRAALILALAIAAAASADAAKRDSRPARSRVHVVGLQDLETGASLGSGVLAAGGKVLTDCHVLGTATRVGVRRTRTSSTAELNYADRKRDLCELKLRHPERFPVAKLELRAAKALAAGETVIALGAWDGYPKTSSGRVVKIGNRDGDYVILISSRLAAGYDGGALLDTRGALLGIVTHKERSTRMLSYAYPAQYVLVRKKSEDESAIVPAAERIDPTPAAAAERTRSRQDIDEYLRRLADASRGNVKYPPEARELGWGGTSTIHFEVAAGGEIGASFVDTSSGYAGLDVAALLAVRQALAELDLPDVVKAKGLKGSVSITFASHSR